MKEYLSMSITELHECLLEDEITPVELVKLAIEKAKKDNNNAFEYILEKEALEMARNLDINKKHNLLWGIPYTLKDNFSTKDIPTCASSNILDGYIPVFSSEVYERLTDQGAILIGKVTLDELAMGGRGISGHLGPTFNPYDKTHTRICGGSSCGSAASVAAGIVPFSIGSDTGDSVRKPASFTGLVGIKPTWGRISRFGLLPFSQSLDHVGVFTRNVLDTSIVLKAISGKDIKDVTSSKTFVDDYPTKINSDLKGKKIAIVDEIYRSFTNEKVKMAFEKTIEELKKLGLIVNYVHIDIDLLKAIYPTYIIISCAEATSNNAALDGIKYGKRYEAENYEKMMFEARTNGFSSLIKRRLVIGSYALLKENQEEIFLKAKKCRRVIVNAFNEVLKDNDFIYLPASPSIAPYFEEPSIDKLDHEFLLADNYLAFANLGGYPSITIPLGFIDSLPFGGNITGRLFEESLLLSISKKIEDITGLSNLVAEDK